MKRCSSCILPESYPGIEFDDAGSCSICRSYTPGSVPRSEQVLEEEISPFRGSGERYDCIVAFSGGRDSSYILWYAVRHLGLKALGLFTDNGFAPEHTHRNLNRTSDILGTDLHIEKYSSLIRSFPGMLRVWMKKPSAATVGMLCTGCTYGRRLKLPLTAQKYRIPLMLVGGGEPERSFAESLLASGKINPAKGQLVRGFARQSVRNPWLLLSPGRSLMFLLEFAVRYKENHFLRLMRIRYPEKKVFPYSYLGWNEKTIMDTITSELDWQKGDMCGTPWRSDCLIAPLKNYIYGALLGFHKVDEILAGMVRMGQIERDKALERLPLESWVNPAYLDSFLRNHGCSLQELDRAVSSVVEK